MDFVFGLAVGGLVGFLMRQMVGLRKAGAPAGQADSEQQPEKLQKVLALFKGKEAVTNNEVQLTLGVSDATATRYLEELERLGKIAQVGYTGRAVTYRKL